MQEDQIRVLLESVSQGKVNIDDAVNRLRTLPYESVGNFAQLDHHRALRCGFPEVVFGQGKTTDQIVQIVLRLSEKNDRVMVTRVTAEMNAQIQPQVPGLVYHPAARIQVLDHSIDQPKKSGVFVLTAGTADIPVAEEAALTAEIMGNQVERLFDVGVAGIHRLLNQVDRLQRARVVIVVAGMDGALPSVVGGLVSVPVIAVPTSVGYGASFQGLAALLTLLNSCATGVAVVNIDNGFGAGVLASRINLMENPA
ncbi:MAG: nickel pincer cofactor biosynthesis protein LarB [Anaerolineaceae bacterium]|nr:nickel pincer cofactor biosynthesis protein LarB [Anaerolineaceae bacterium]